MMGTKIFQIWPKGAEKIELKDFNLHSEIMTRTSFYRVQSVLQWIKTLFWRAIAPSLLSNIQM